MVNLTCESCDSDALHLVDFEANKEGLTASLVCDDCGKDVTLELEY